MINFVSKKARAFIVGNQAHCIGSLEPTFKVINTLAYYGMELIAAVKSFIV